jgi:hypothetical protein
MVNGGVPFMMVVPVRCMNQFMRVANKPPLKKQGLCIRVTYINGLLQAVDLHLCC